MTARKISELTALTAPASGDYLPIVDISEVAAANKNKRITIEELMRGAPSGTAAAPGIAFESDPTGIYSPGADQLAISTNGTGRLFVDSSGRVGVGTSPLYPLHVEKNQEDLLALVNTGVVTYRLQVKNDASFAVVQNATERVRIDSSGRLLVGISTARSNFFNTSTYSPGLQLEGVTDQNRFVSIVGSNSAGAGGTLILASQTSGGIGGNAIVSNGGQLGVVSFHGNDGTEFVEAARIQVEVDGTPGANDMPGRLVFFTTADGASSPTERMRIKSSGIVNVGNTPVYADNTAAKAGGLVDGDVYRKSDGTLMIVYT